MTQSEHDLSAETLEQHWAPHMEEIPAWFRKTALALGVKRAVDIYFDTDGLEDRNARYREAIEAGSAVVQSVKRSVMWMFNTDLSRRQAENVAVEHGFGRLMLLAAKRLRDYGYIDIMIPETHMVPGLCETITRLHEKRAIRQIRVREEFECREALDEFTWEHGILVKYYKKQKGSETQRASDMLDNGNGFIVSGMEVDPITDVALTTSFHNWARVPVTPPAPDGDSQGNTPGNTNLSSL